MCEFISWCDLKPSEQAAWVQAIGSVLAILVALAIPVIGRLIKYKEEQHLRKEKMLNALLQIFDPLNSLRVSLDEYYETTAPNYDHENPGVSIDPSQGDFQSLVPTMITSVASLNDMGNLAPSLRKFLFKLIELDRYFKLVASVQRSGSPGFWRNNIDDIRNMVKDVMDEADTVLEKIKGTMKAEKLS